MQSTPHPWLRLSSLVVLAALLALGSFSACSGTSVTAKPLPTATTGAIQIAVSQTEFTVSQPVGVNVTNTSNNTYYSVSGRTACTFLQLQELDTAKNAWVNVYGCPAANPTPLQITQHISEPFTLAPSSPSNQNAWDPGTYRVAVAYSTSSDGSSSPMVAFSAAFTIDAG